MSFSFNAYSSADQAFAERVLKEHRVPVPYTLLALQKAAKDSSVIQKMDYPREKLPWEKYRSFFVNDQKTKKAKAFQRKYRTLLRRVEKRYKVPAKLVVSIIGVESDFGRYKHRYFVLNSLYTLAFHYPRRAKFFKNELAAFLAWTYRSKIDPLVVKGSYAGAIGMPQFMPSNILKYGVDFDLNHTVDIEKSMPDALGSIAYYIKKHGWKYGKPTAVKTKPIKKRILKKVAKKTMTVRQLRRKGVRLSIPMSGSYKVKVAKFESTKKIETWALFDNFKSIMRYNPNKQYALAVFLLSRNI